MWFRDKSLEMIHLAHSLNCDSQSILSLYLLRYTSLDPKDGFGLLYKHDISFEEPSISNSQSWRAQQKFCFLNLMTHNLSLDHLGCSSILSDLGFSAPIISSERSPRCRPWATPTGCWGPASGAPSSLSQAGRWTWKHNLVKKLRQRLHREQRTFYRRQGEQLWPRAMQTSFQYNFSDLQQRWWIHGHVTDYSN